MKTFFNIFQLCLIVLATLITSSVFAQNQVRITLHQPPPNQLTAGDLWKMTLENTTGSPLEIYLEGYGEEQSKGRIVDGRSQVFTLPVGRTNYNYENFKSGNVSWKNKEYEEFIIRTGTVPAGTYTTCVTAYSNDGMIVGIEKCITQIISRGFEGEITLISPSDGDNIDASTPVNFSWTPLPGGGSYKIKIVEILGNESPENAMLKNKAFFEKEDLRMTTFQYPSSAPKFVDGKRYVWIVQTGDLQSEFYTFKIMPGLSVNCDLFVAEGVQNPLGECCRSINLTHPGNTSNITGIQFLALTPNSFVTGSASIGSSYNSGWIYPVNTLQEFTIKKISGIFPTGQLNNFFNFCLNNLSSPQQVVVNWLLSDNSVACSDTVNVYCDIPCVTIIEDTLICNENNYNLDFKFTNNASFPINKIEVMSITPSGVSVTTPTLTLLSAVNPGQTSNLISNSVVGAIPGEPLCIILKYTSPDACCWCYDTICVEVPSCVCDEVEASITGDPVNCCFNLSLQNTYSNSYFDKVKVRTLDPGVVFSTWSTNVSNNYYSTNTFADNEINLVFNPPNGYFPISGNPAFVLNYCLNGYTTTTQSIVVEWMRNDSVKCADTLITNCVPPPPVTPCVQILNDTLICLPDGTFQYNFAVKNNSSHQTTGFQFNPISPSGLTFTPANFSSVSIAPGMVSSPQSMIISGVPAGGQFCFKISLYEHLYLNGQMYYDWCCYSDTICMTAPTCPTNEPCNFEVLIDSVKCEQNAAGGWGYQIKTKIFNPTGTTATLHSVLADNGTMNCSPQTLAPGMNLLTCYYNLTGTLSNPTCFTYRILRPGSMDTCIVKVCRDLIPCTTPTGCLDLISVDSVKCIGQNAAGGFNYTFKITINNPTSSPIASSTLTSQCGGLITGLPSSFAVGTHQYTGTISTPYPGVQQCCLLYQNGSCIDQICFDLPTCPTGCLDIKSVEIVKCLNKNTGGGFDYSFNIIINNPTSAPIANTLTTQCNGTLSGLPSSFAPGTNQYSGTLSTTNPNLTQCCIIYSNAACIKEKCFQLPKCVTENPCQFDFLSQTIMGCVKLTPSIFVYNITMNITNTGAPVPSSSITSSFGTISNLPSMIPTGTNIPVSFNLTTTGAGVACIIYNGPVCSDSLCFDLGPCNPPQGCNCTNGKWNETGSTLRYSSNGISTDVPINCNTTYNIDPNSSISLWPSYTCPQPGCAVKFKYKVNNGAITGFQSSPFNVSNINVSTQVTIYAYCGDVICDSCMIVVNPKVEECDCGEWKNKTVSITANGISRKTECGGELEITPSNNVSITFPDYLCSPNTCTPIYNWTISGPIVQSGTSNQITNANFSQPGTYYVTIVPRCGTKDCQPCRIIIIVKGEGSSCDCKGWVNDNPNILIRGFNKEGGYDEIEEKVQCGKTFASVNKGRTMDLGSATYMCSSTENCQVSYKFTITAPSGIVTVHNSQSVSNFLFSEVGVYNIKLSVSCNGKECDSCNIFVRVVDVPTGCNCGFFWLPGKYQISGGALQSVSTGQTINLPVPSAINFDYNGAFGCNPPGSNCPPNYNWVISGPGVNTNQSSTNPVFTQNFPQPNSTYTVSMTAMCGTEKCSGPSFTVKTGGSSVCECGSWNGGIRVDGSGIGCNQSFNFLFNKGYRSVQGPTMSCNPNVQNCSPQYSYTVMLNGLTVHSGSGNSFNNFYFQSNKLYTIIFNANCGNIVCQPCSTTIRIKGTIFGGIGNATIGNIGIKNPNVVPSIFNPSGSLRPDFKWSSSISPGKEGNLSVIEVKPGMSMNDLSELVKELSENDPFFEVTAGDKGISYPKEMPDLTRGSYYVWIVYEADDQSAKILDGGIFKAGSTTAAKEIINCDDCEKMCPDGRCWRIGDKCFCF